MWRLTSLAAAASIAFTMTVQAETLMDKAASASNMLEAGKAGEALEQATSFRDAVWAAAPIGFTTATLTDGAATGYGKYTPRASNHFKAEEQITIYCEPVGYDYGRDGDDYLIDLDADIELHTPKGHILVRQEAFARLSSKSRRQVREFHVSLSLTLSGLKPGDYILVTKMRDAHSDKTGMFSLPIRIAVPEPKPKPEQN